MARIRPYTRSGALFIGMLWMLSACGGGGGGGGVPGGEGSHLLSITVEGLPAPLWTNSAGVGSPGCPGPVPLNSRITFTFSGAIDVQSVPSNANALGSINVTRSDGNATVPAQGSFVVDDDPSLPPGNRRQLTFFPQPPTSAANPELAGLVGDATYNVFVPRAGSSPQVLRVGGNPIVNEANACFFTCDPPPPPGPGEPDPGPGPCFVDPQAGAAYVMTSIPATGDPSPAAVEVSSIVNNTVTMMFSEPLYPVGIDLENVRLIESISTQQVPGSVVFFQAGTPEAGPAGARIDYVASAPLLDGVTYEIVLGPLVRDLGGNPVTLFEGGPALRRMFSTLPAAFCAQTPFSEDFTTTTNRGEVSQFMNWDNSGSLTIDYPTNLFGDGSFGPLTLTGNATLDSGQASTQGFSDGNWMVDGFTVAAGADVRCVGPFRIHIRSQGVVQIDGRLNGNAGNQPAAAIGSPEQGAQPGIPNNGGPGSNIVFGGVPGPGGGRGGHASQDGAARTTRGEPGRGATDDGSENGDPASVRFGGGDGGAGNAQVPAVSPGGYGGAGGSAFLAGGDGGPTAVLFCFQLPLVQGLTRAVAPPPQPAFLFPFTVASAGAGGGGGGDLFNAIAASDGQGGAGGGGGGGIRISSVLDVNLGPTAQINLDGGDGAIGAVFAGAGGGGSGGMLWLQSLGEIVIAGGTELTVDPGDGGNVCGPTFAGDGGFGAYQFEDIDGVVNTNFAGAAGGAGNISVEQIQIGASVVGTATSGFFDTGYGSPRFTSAQVAFDLGTAPGGAVLVEFQGAPEALMSTPENPIPDLANLSGWFTSGQVASLDGLRFVRFRATLSYDAPPTADPSDIRPSVQSVDIAYETPIGCQ